jgi:hypothetical protein
MRNIKQNLFLPFYNVLEFPLPLAFVSFFGVLLANDCGFGNVI